MVPVLDYSMLEFFQLLVCDGWNSDKSLEDNSAESNENGTQQQQDEVVEHQQQEVAEEQPELLERPKSAQEKVKYFFHLDESHPCFPISEIC